MFRVGLICLLFSTSLAVAQTPAASPAPAATIAPAATTLRTGVQLVVVDVVVTDHNGRPVPGLRQQDFTLTENRTAQPVKGFEEHGSAAAPAVGSTAVRVPMRSPTATFRNVPLTRGQNAVDVLLIDALNTPPQAQLLLRNQLVKFLAEEKPDTQVAIFVLNTRLGMLQDFTTDPALLQRVIQRQGVKFSPLLHRDKDDSAVMMESETSSGLITTSDEPGMADMLRTIQSTLMDMDVRQRSDQTQTRVRTTLDALGQLARYLAGVPGRKNLLWFSGSFPINIQRDIQTTGSPFAGTADLSAEMQRTTDLLARSQVAVYAIDARGLQSSPGQNAEVGGSRELLNTQRTYATTSATPIDTQFFSDQAAEHNTLREMAESTGGEAFYNTNGLADAARRAAADGQNYYTLLYTPTAGGKAGDYRSITVKVNRPGVKLAYRRGYYRQATADGTVRPDAGVVRSAMAVNAPQASEVAIEMQPGVLKSAGGDKVIGIKAAGDAPIMLVALNMNVDVKTLSFVQGTDGKMHGTLDLATVIYDSKGNVADSREDRAALVLEADRYQAMLADGLRYRHVIALPASGEGNVRMAVHDAATDSVGSLQVSIDTLRRTLQTAK